MYGSGGLLRHVETAVYDRPSVLIPSKGSLNHIMYIDHPFRTTNEVFWTIIDGRVVNPKFLYYYLKTIDFMRLNVGTASPALTTDVINNVQITIPRRPVQKQIAGLLTLLEDKIAMNQRINENLEQQALALYRSWFVDFDPYRDGEFVDSALGKIPKGWRVMKLSEFMPVFRGRSSQDVANGGPYPFFCSSPEIYWTEKCIYEGSAILVAGYNDFHVTMYSGKFDASKRTYVLIPYEQHLTPWLYYVIQSRQAQIARAAKGSIIQYITRDALTDMQFAAPADLTNLPILEELTRIRKYIASNEAQSHQLATIRDSLLPKLMKGEIRFK